MLITLLQQFDEASIPLAIALALQARGVSDAASFAFNTAFAQAESEASDDRADGGRVVAALRALRLRL
jgi:hypothetical protein